jgi:nitrogenase iron protein NifH
LEELDRLDAVSVYKPDYILYDVLGDVVCGVFALPIRKGYADSVYIVTSGERMALFAANNICQSVRNSSERGYASVKGLILNKRNVKNEDSVVAEAAEKMGTEVVCTIPRTDDIQTAEEEGRTVVSLLPDSVIAGKYRELARLIGGYDE